MEDNAPREELSELKWSDTGEMGREGLLSRRYSSVRAELDLLWWMSSWSVIIEREGSDLECCSGMDCKQVNKQVNKQVHILVSL